MRFVVASFGSRGDVEPCAAIGRELVRRGHQVRIAVSPNMLGFVESVGLAAVAYGPDSQALLQDESFVRSVTNPISALPDVVERVTQAWMDKSTVLMSLAQGADLLLAGMNEQPVAANVAEYCGIPVAALHFFPPVLPVGALHSRIVKEAEDAHRRALGLAEVSGSSRSLEIQAYDELCLPGLAAGWAEDANWRPFVGALTLELATAADDEVLSWITAGRPPIYFGFGSTPITSPTETVAMISAACTQLGERALICSGANDFSTIPLSDCVKVVDAVNHAVVFPACRAVVHHGGAGTTAAALRAGIPALILWFWLDQPIWAAAVERLKVGCSRQFSTVTLESLVEDLSSVLAPQYITRAGQVADQMTKSAQSVASAADLLEDAARRGRFG
ncbi:glycosyltransferase [Mycobacterium heckeshornense]|nr:glycosyltransferase [Mycobacterium heckeshornense]KMV20945.1 glycosyltransferase [Mycobacterium heckeshornense]MCV7036230.1 glycosyltransferase [Mycobacterium heckeshornense]PIJ35808.1 glycosyltransferase [Mycobacterium heckeshornense]